MPPEPVLALDVGGTVDDSEPDDEVTGVVEEELEPVVAVVVVGEDVPTVPVRVSRIVKVTAWDCWIAPSMVGWRLPTDVGAAELRVER